MNTLSLKEKIDLEKRRKNQAYLMLDYEINTSSPFDFFSADAFKMVQIAKYLSRSLNHQKVGLFHFILCFFYIKSNLRTLLNEFGISEATFEFLLEKPKRKANLKEDFKLKIKKLKIEFVEIILFIQDKHKKLPNFSNELITLFEKSNEIALKKFKTPVVTLEILFFTLLEENKNFADFIKTQLKNDLSFDFLKYRLLKQIHCHESTIREYVPKNYHYFAYLLKTQLSEFEFDYLIENKIVPKTVLYFRNLLMAKILTRDIFNDLFLETKTSMRLTNFRKYSS